MLRYLKLLYYFGRINLQQQIAYRPSFITAIIGKVLRMFLVIIFWQAIFYNIPNIKGWNFNAILILIASYLLVENIMVISFHRNLAYYLPNLIRKGEYDFILIKPINPLFYSSFRIIDFFDVFSGLAVVGLWIYIIFQVSLPLSWLAFLLYLLALVLALGFIYSLMVLLSSSTFWTITSQGIGRFFEEVIRTAQFPTDIFKGTLRTIFLFVFPIIGIATLPAKIFQGQINWHLLAYFAIFVIILVFISIKFWFWALKHYSSASS